MFILKTNNTSIYLADVSSIQFVEIQWNLKIVTNFCLTTKGWYCWCHFETSLFYFLKMKKCRQEIVLFFHLLYVEIYKNLISVLFSAAINLTIHCRHQLKCKFKSCKNHSFSNYYCRFVHVCVCVFHKMVAP